MPRKSTIDLAKLATLIRSRGPISATELAALLRVNRTTIIRALDGFHEDLAILGATRSTRYVMRRQVRQAGNRWPVYRIDPQGVAHEWAELEAFHDLRWHITWAEDPPEWADHFMERNGMWHGFPFFLSDARPQGFLGRLIAERLAPLLGLPEDPRRWSDDDALVYLHAAGADTLGDLVVGDAALRSALTAQATPTLADESDYPSIAMNIASQLPGSSAGGEQPKFAATTGCGDSLCPVLVKFSAPMDTPTGRRWADLLACEFQAHQVLAEAGLSNLGARLLDSGGRRFLEIPRFDRTAAGGRIGLVSLEALSAATVGLQADWQTAGSKLHDLGFIGGATLDSIKLLQAFGERIGNTDMHPGNLTFFLSDSLPWVLAPAYDMLPMLWAPGPQGEIMERKLTTPRPIPAMAEACSRAEKFASDFWQRVKSDPRVSQEFIEASHSANFHSPA